MTSAPALRPAQPAWVRTVAVEGPGALLDRLPHGPVVAWVTGAAAAPTGMVGWGEAARLEVAGPERFSRAQRWWAQWVAAAHVDGSEAFAGSTPGVASVGWCAGPVAFCSFTFDPASAQPSVLVVPEVLLRSDGAHCWVTVVGAEPRAADALLERTLAELGGPTPLPDPPRQVSWAQGARSAPEWQAAVVEAVRRIDAGELDKVVLARDVVATADAPIDVRHLLRRLSGAYPSCWSYAVDGLVGATPELLVRRSGDEVASRVLAGTVRRSTDSGRDASLATELLGSAKDLAEHEYAVESVAASLAAHCTDLQVPAQPSLLRLANVQHLATEVTGVLADSSPALALAASLHPTAAVCGTPAERALAVIRELEGMERGRYAGPVGWVDASGDGELGIALRCGLVSDSAVRLYAGCGIVAGSDPDAELAESQAKLVAMRDALEPD